MGGSLEAELAALDVRFRVIGGSTGADLDIVVPAEDAANLLRALDRIGCPAIPSVRTLVSGRPCRIVTSLGPLDVFVEA